MTQTGTEEDTRDLRLPAPPKHANGIYIGPMYYSRFLRQVADALDAIIAFGAPDLSNIESTHFLAGAALPLFNEEMVEDEDMEAGLVGWLVQEDGPLWAFVPHIPHIAAGSSSARSVGVQ